jgi:hypothetical protein
MKNIMKGVVLVICAPEIVRRHLTGKRRCILDNLEDVNVLNVLETRSYTTDC